MKKIRLTSFILIIIGSLFISCERDDICAEATVTTPKLVIEFFDAENTGDLKNIRDLEVREIEKETNDSLLFNSGSSIAIPLKTDAIETSYVFNLNALAESGGLTDTLTFSYSTEELYVSRACGFKVDFIDLRVDLENQEDNPQSWIRDIEIRETIIENEAETHLFIYY